VALSRIIHLGSRSISTSERAASPAWLLTVAVLSLVVPSVPARALADGFNLRSTANLALMVSSDQVQRMKYERPGILGALHAGYEVRPSLELRAGVTGGGFFTENRRQNPTGGLLGGTLGVRLQAPARKYRPWAAVDLGMGATGELLRPLFWLSIGVDIAFAERFALGPVLGYARLFQWNGRGYSDDAGSFAVGASFVVALDRRAVPPPPKPAVQRVPVRHVRKEEPPAPPAAPSDDVLVLIERALPTPTRTELLAPVLFAFDSDSLEPIGVAMLHETAGTLAARPEIELLEIRGYADERGDVVYNQALSLRRAERVRDWLVAHGVSGERLVVAGHGEHELVEAGADERDHLQNRRVVFRVLREAPHAD
jgi:outer membrane protein OmpA-like peptidoglycan-associated protein